MGKVVWPKDLAFMVDFDEGGHVEKKEQITSKVEKERSRSLPWSC